MRGSELWGGYGHLQRLHEWLGFRGQLRDEIKPNAHAKRLWNGCSPHMHDFQKFDGTFMCVEWYLYISRMWVWHGRYDCSRGVHELCALSVIS